MIEDYFGFEVFSLHITKSSMRNAWTIAVSSRYDVLTPHRNLVSSKNGFKYNKKFEEYDEMYTAKQTVQKVRRK